jgi:PIN domain nuclease of toxin-antitoxin system
MEVIIAELLSRRPSRDPFDHVTVPHAEVESTALMTAGPAFQRYDVEVVEAA